MNTSVWKKTMVRFRLLLLMFMIFPALLKAEKNWQVGISVQYLQPAGALADWFEPAASVYGLSVVHSGEDRWRYRFQVEAFEFAEGNQEALVYDDLRVRLEIYGAGLGWEYTLREGSRFILPYLTWDVGIYRWFGERGDYSLSEPDQGRIVYVPARNQRDWSWGGGAGLGVEMNPAPHFCISASLRYRLIIGELWPALALDLENVSSFHMISGMLTLAYRF